MSLELEHSKNERETEIIDKNSDPLYNQEPFLSFPKEIFEFSMPNEKKK